MSGHPPGESARPIHEPGEVYDGPARIVLETGEVAVDVRLRGGFQPIDGRFHWYGRIGADSVADQRLSSGSTVRIVTSYGAASGRLSDIDPWGRLRISGTGTPPF